MVQRHVYVKLNEAHLPHAEDLARTSITRLSAVPGVRAVHASLPGDPDTARSWDLCLVLSFDDLAAVLTYVPHPLHRAYLAEVLEPAAVVKKAWNFAPLS